MPSPGKTWAFIIRNRLTLWDAAITMAAIMLVGGLFLEIRVFGNVPEGTLYEQSIDLSEALTLGGLVFVALLYLAARHIKELKREIDRRLAAEREARVLAFHDALTDLPNRRMFDNELTVAIAAPPRAGGSHAVFLLDLNGFKRVNDVFGHPIGDSVLIAVAQRLKGALRENDLISRLGGDEFAVLARQLSGPEEATSLALRIIRSLDEPIVVGSTNHAIGLGIGIALAPQDGNSSEEIIRKADIALYRAKGERGSVMRFFEPEMDAHIRERDALERALRAAVNAGLIEPYYQPLFELQTGKVVGLEALARWHDAVLGDVPPDRFIPIAEECGLIDRLTDQLLRRACADARNWPSEVQLSFNVSSVLLKNRTFGLQLLAILADTGLAPPRLELELTESALVRDLPAAAETLGRLRDVGIRLALDDFGTGYSSLYHLRNFRVDKIKIDRSFIETMTSRNESAELVRAMLGLGQGLGLTVTAEGIEKPEQLKLLLSQGCIEGQGFLFSKAVPASETAAFFSVGGADARRKAVT